MNVRQRYTVRLRGWGRFYLSNQVWGVVLAGFGQMDFLADPGNVPTLGTVAGFGIMGRGDALG